MNCATFQEHYEQYVRDELSPLRAPEFEEHAANCPPCQQWLEMQQVIGETLRVSAQSNLPADHYFEGLFQRTAPQLLRPNRWGRIRNALLQPFEVLLFSNSMFPKLARMATICAMGIGIGLFMGGDEAISKWVGSSGGRSQTLTSARAEATRGEPVDQARAAWSRFSNAMQGLITPKMKSDVVAAPQSREAELVDLLHEKKVFEQIDLVKYTLIRDGDMDQLPRILKIENDLLNAGQIKDTETWLFRRQCVLVREALNSMASQDAHSALGFLEEVEKLNPSTRWACLAQFVSASLLDQLGQTDRASEKFKSCLERFPREFLNDAQVAHAMQRQSAR